MRRPALAALLVLLPALAVAQTAPPTTGASGAGRLGLMDVFELEYASDPQVSPDGRTVVYRRNRLDVQTDRVRGDLWAVGADGQDHRPLVTGVDASSPRWSPDGTRLAYVARDADEDRRHLVVRYLETGATVPVARLETAPGGVAWSPDGTQIAFTRFVEGEATPLATLPAPPEGAEWAEAPRVIESVIYRQDGQGFTTPGNVHVFVVPAEGGTPRQVTRGPYDHGGTPAWTPDGAALVVSADRRDGAEFDPGNSELYRVDLRTGALTALTDRVGPDGQPAVSPDGRRLAYVGTDDRGLGYQVSHLYVMDLDGGTPRRLLPALDRDVQDPTWSGDEIVFQYDDEGTTRLAAARADGRGGPREIASDVGGTSIGRPYGGGSFSVGGGRVAFTMTDPSHPADVAVVPLEGGVVERLTDLNGDLFATKRPGAVEEITFASSADGREIEGWVLTPPDFDASRRYPLILEIHGGPFANYGPRFSMEAQLYAAAGYVVLYTNPRGSTSYGEDFGNLIHNNYPSQDYDDLMSGVDALVARGTVDPDRLYVTGGSGGGVLTAWIVGHTDRFAAAVVAKPVINWASWLLTADMYPFGAKYWFDTLPWEAPDAYWDRSPLAYVGNVTTPTMVLTGEDDTRTPMSESEQYYQALQIERVPSALVRVPGAAHGIAARPSGLMRKVGYILAWFERYGGPGLASLAGTGGGE
ncbi:S9 family peptidase [Rubrivirga sp. S365]|uniref:S9 family peptidase n=1 Tax=Rubrivirga litoralis TaxID=3075598 RepID=A0ABU3BVE1_9BACT|nr:MULTISPECIES: S9 family peptidase [unclassified Rubrivirga]MDT0633264.1 S9 family peptidase [Rubrivirga sp. F394]MDT7855087.1 S9 family peptidase [Rubrivirga sp. S365]